MKATCLVLAIAASCGQRAGEQPIDCSPQVGAAFAAVSELLMASHDSVIAFGVPGENCELVTTLAETASLAAGIAIELGDDSLGRSTFRGPGSWMPRDPVPIRKSSLHVLAELERTSPAKRRTPDRYAAQLRKIRDSIEVLRKTDAFDKMRQRADPDLAQAYEPLIKDAVECVALASRLIDTVSP